LTELAVATRPLLHLAWSRPAVVAVVCCVVALAGSTGFERIPSGRPHSRIVHVAVVAHKGATALYVSPSGNDKNSGTSARPLRTLAHAQSVVRSLNGSMKSNITVYLKSGIYHLSRPLQFGPQDSGSNGHTVIWAGAPGASATISGATRISGWKLNNRVKNIWSAHVPAGLNTRQIYVNGMRAVLPAGPPPAVLKKTSSGYRASSSAMAGWRNAGEIDFVYTAQAGLMVEPICPVASVKGKSIRMAQPCWNNSNRRGHNNLVGYGTLQNPSYIENAYELLSAPGQFYLDRSNHTMYYIPRAGQNMPTADVEAPRLQTLVEGGGSARSPLHHVEFSNLQFSYATWMQPSAPEGFSDMQSGYSITGSRGYATQGLCQFASHGTCPYGSWTKEPAAVQLTNDRKLTFRNDLFDHLGAAGLDLGDGSQSDSVTASDFTDISGDGIEIGGVDMPQAAGGSQTRSIAVSDNHVYGVGVDYHGAVAILVGYAAGSVITHNQVDHVPYSGISVGWGGWPDKRKQPPVANFSRNNVVSDNLIYDFMQTLSDGGGVYTQGITGPSMAAGEKVTGNVIHDQLAWGRALQSDDGATFVTYDGNVLYNDNYDWGSNHVDYVTKNGNYDPQLIKNNYWQQGDGNLSSKGVTEKGNKLITGPSQVPGSVLAGAGIPHRYHSVLSWQPPGENVPNPPDRVAALYAFHTKAYVTWRPSFAAGDTAVGSYTVTVCRARGGVAQDPCGSPAGKQVTISAGGYNRLGYAVVTGLHNGTSYSFTVTASSRGGSSTPSPASAVATVSSHGPGRPGRAQSLGIRVAPGVAKLVWYSPASATSHPVLAYKVTISNGLKATITGLRQLIVGNNGGHVVQVFGGLVGGRSYRFSVAAVTPAGAGPAVSASMAIPK
jgi:Fibronectin type III domain